MTTQPFATPVVRKVAAQLGVSLATVTPTGAGGRIRVEDVRAAAGQPSTGPVPTVHAEAPARGRAIPVRSRFDERATVELDVFGPNPLLEDARQASPLAYSMATREAPPPTLFADGDLPSFTSSGVDPRELRKVPWYARHFVAAATDASVVLRAVEQFAHDPDDVFREFRHQGALDYERRVRDWLSGAGVPV